MENLTLYDYITVECGKRKITVRELAKKIDVGVPTLYKTKQARPGNKVYGRLAAEFNVPINELRNLPIILEEEV